MIPRLRRLALASAGALLAGCTGLHERYGYGRVAPADTDIPEQDIAVVLPPGAPSISQRYRPLDRYPGLREGGAPHEGIDLFVLDGTPVLAAAPGTVADTGLSPMYGRTVALVHGPLAEAGDGGHLCTRYYHLGRIDVRAGEAVRRGQPIGRSGRSGLLAGGFPHLHFEVRRCDARGHDRGHVNPQRFWVDGVGRVTCFDPRRRWPEAPVRLTYPAPCRGIPWPPIP
ncbi:M23 family metallopeptidase [Inmirania thermothiophila]|uniref:Peptidase M23-like protein n=1 Tax=Inmirania thermothiophila TaxID=1750597 RepID=A0A3N1Y179_9GAMM|nr:M23 family metallopeptidase [Inmirania thermothiophila]ROR32301.1 peptidase M23-like protein [Inmirania thermothiophila]